MTIYIHFVALSWLVALFIKTPIAFHLSKVLGRAVVCPLCLGWYLGFTLGIVHICNGLVTFDWYFPVVSAMITSGAAFIIHVLLDIVDAIHTRVLLWEAK